ncbi:MAG: hypothetical protein QOG61_7 [Candidatus Binataceae bacterium]|jgi:hypothetical protein|nr:hypothetical protein [Candidatus Binataceae bacterium]
MNKRLLPFIGCRSQSSQRGARRNQRIRILAHHFTWVRQIVDVVRRLLREAIAELARLNRTGLDTATLTGKSRRDRARTVAMALAHRHDGPTRCC